MKRALLTAACAIWTSTAAAEQPCRHALALGLDVSGSVDAREYRLQIDGLATALNSSTVRAAILAQPETPIELMVFEWSGPKDQLTLLPWTRITTADTLDTAITQIRSTERRADATPGTALGVAMLHGAAQLAKRSHCWRRTLDISGDGKSNLGPRPRTLKQRIAAQGITINALVIGADDPASGDIRQHNIAELTAYFSAEVILGPHAFTKTALGFEDYARAMQAKLLRELDGLVLSQR